MCEQLGSPSGIMCHFSCLILLKLDEIRSERQSLDYIKKAAGSAEFIIPFWSIISLIPEKPQRFLCLIVSLMTKKEETLRHSGGLLLHCAAFIPAKLYVRLNR